MSGEDESTTVPTIGARIARTVGGITTAGTVHYADQLQVLVKWDNGKSSSLRVGRDPYTILPGAKSTRSRLGREADIDAPLTADTRLSARVRERLA
jgi:hypothetical protein